MDDAAFLDQVQVQLAEIPIEDVDVIAVQPTGGRPWARTEVTFKLANSPTSWQGPIHGSAYAPLSEKWRFASGYETPSDYAQLLADEVESAAKRLAYPDPPSPPLSPEQVSERWEWLLERLALNGPVEQVSRHQLEVSKEDGSSFTVLVQPEEWARIASPLDPNADDPQDFNQLTDDEAYLVFYEDRLVWSIQPELPPVRWGADVRRAYQAAKAEGKTDIGWFAYAPPATSSRPKPND